MRPESLSIERNWSGFVSSAVAHQHLKSLSLQGVGIGAVKVACGVSLATLSGITSGKKPLIQKRTEKKILSTCAEELMSGAYISSEESWKLLNLLLKKGHSRTDLAHHLGYPTLQVSRGRISVQQAKDIQTIYTELVLEEAERVVIEAKKTEVRKCPHCTHVHDPRDWRSCIRILLPKSSEWIMAHLKRYQGPGGSKKLFKDLQSMGAEGDNGIWRIPLPLK